MNGKKSVYNFSRLRYPHSERSVLVCGALKLTPQTCLQQVHRDCNANHQADSGTSSALLAV